MSWIENINNGLQIITGDGKTYSPQWLNAAKVKEWNTAEFDYIGVKGTLVRRAKVRGRKYALEIYFQGEEHLSVVEAFETSTEDPRPWTILHPFYGEITVQPISLNFDNKDLNLTKIMGQVMETIEANNPKFTINPVDKVILDKEALDETTAEILVYDIPEPDQENLNLFTDNVVTLYKEGKKKIENALDAEAYFNAFNEANRAITDLTQFPLESMRKIQAIINAPFLFADTVKNRIDTMVNQFNLLRSSLNNLLRKSNKKIYEINQGTLVSAIASAAVVNYKYANRGDVVNTIDRISSIYDQHILDLDSIQNENGGNPASYIPDANSITQISDLVGFVISNLFQIAINAKQERSFFLEDDTNVITLTQRLYGIDEQNTMIDQLISDNEIGLNEMLGLRKGRKIVYYV